MSVSMVPASSISPDIIALVGVGAPFAEAKQSTKSFQGRVEWQELGLVQFTDSLGCVVSFVVLTSGLVSQTCSIANARLHDIQS